MLLASVSHPLAFASTSLYLGICAVAYGGAFRWLVETTARKSGKRTGAYDGPPASPRRCNATAAQHHLARARRSLDRDRVHARRARLLHSDHHDSVRDSLAADRTLRALAVRENARQAGGCWCRLGNRQRHLVRTVRLVACGRASPHRRAPVP